MADAKDLSGVDYNGSSGQNSEDPVTGIFEARGNSTEDTQQTRTNRAASRSNKSTKEQSELDDLPTKELLEGDLESPKCDRTTQRLTRADTTQASSVHNDTHLNLHDKLLFESVGDSFGNDQVTVEQAHQPLVPSVQQKQELKLDHRTELSISSEPTNRKETTKDAFDSKQAAAIVPTTQDMEMDVAPSIPEGQIATNSLQNIVSEETSLTNSDSTPRTPRNSFAVGAKIDARKDTMNASKISDVISSLANKPTHNAQIGKNIESGNVKSPAQRAFAQQASIDHTSRSIAAVPVVGNPTESAKIDGSKGLDQDRVSTIGRNSLQNPPQNVAETANTKNFSATPIAVVGTIAQNPGATRALAGMSSGKTNTLPSSVVPNSTQCAPSSRAAPSVAKLPQSSPAPSSNVLTNTNYSDVLSADMQNKTLTNEDMASAPQTATSSTSIVPLDERAALEESIRQERLPLVERYGRFIAPSDQSLQMARERLRTALDQVRALRAAFTERVYGKYRVCLRPPPTSQAIFDKIMANPAAASDKLQKQILALKEEKEMEKKEAHSLNSEITSNIPDAQAMNADNADQLMYISAGLSLVILPEEEIDPSEVDMTRYKDRAPTNPETGQRVRSISQAAAAAGEVMLERARKAAAMREERRRRHQLMSGEDAQKDTESPYSRLQMLSSSGAPAPGLTSTGSALSKAIVESAPLPPTPLAPRPAPGAVAPTGNPLVTAAAQIPSINSLGSASSIATPGVDTSSLLAGSATKTFKRPGSSNILPSFTTQTPKGRSRGSTGLSVNVLLSLNPSADRLNVEGKPCPSTAALLAKGVGSSANSRSTQQRFRHPHPDSLGGRHRALNPVSAKKEMAMFAQNYAHTFLQHSSSLALPPVPTAKDRFEGKPLPFLPVEQASTKRARSAVDSILGQFTSGSQNLKTPDPSCNQKEQRSERSEVTKIGLLHGIQKLNNERREKPELSDPGDSAAPADAVAVEGAPQRPINPGLVLSVLQAVGLIKSNERQEGQPDGEHFINEIGQVMNDSNQKERCLPSFADLKSHWNDMSSKRRLCSEACFNGTRCLQKEDVDDIFPASKRQRVCSDEEKSELPNAVVASLTESTFDFQSNNLHDVAPLASIRGGGEILVDPTEDGSPVELNSDDRNTDVPRDPQNNHPHPHGHTQPSAHAHARAHSHAQVHAHAHAQAQGNARPHAHSHAHSLPHHPPRNKENRKQNARQSERLPSQQSHPHEVDLQRRMLWEDQSNSLAILNSQLAANQNALQPSHPSGPANAAAVRMAGHQTPPADTYHHQSTLNALHLAQQLRHASTAITPTGGELSDYMGGLHHAAQRPSGFDWSLGVSPAAAIAAAHSASLVSLELARHNAAANAAAIYSAQQDRARALLAREQQNVAAAQQRALSSSGAFLSGASNPAFAQAQFPRASAHTAAAGAALLNSSAQAAIMGRQSVSIAAATVPQSVLSAPNVRQSSSSSESRHSILSCEPEQKFHAEKAKDTGEKIAERKKEPISTVIGNATRNMESKSSLKRRVADHPQTDTAICIDLETDSVPAVKRRKRSSSGDSLLTIGDLPNKPVSFKPPLAASTPVPTSLPVSGLPSVSSSGSASVPASGSTSTSASTSESPSASTSKQASDPTSNTASASTSVSASHSIPVSDSSSAPVLDAAHTTVSDTLPVLESVLTPVSLEKEQNEENRNTSSGESVRAQEKSAEVQGNTSSPEKNPSESASSMSDVGQQPNITSAASAVADTKLQVEKIEAPAATESSNEIGMKFFLPPAPPALPQELAKLIRTSRIHEATMIKSWGDSNPSGTVMVEYLISIGTAVPIPKALISAPLKERMSIHGFRSSGGGVSGSGGVQNFPREIIVASILVWLWTNHEENFQSAFAKSGRIDVDPDCKWLIQAAVDSSVQALTVELDAAPRGGVLASLFAASRSGKTNSSTKGIPNTSGSDITSNASSKLDLLTASIVTRALMSGLCIDNEIDFALPQFHELVNFLDECRLCALHSRSQERVLLASLISRRITMSESFAHAYVSSMVRSSEALGPDKLSQIVMDDDLCISTMLPYDVFKDENGVWEDPCRPHGSFVENQTGEVLMRRAHARAMVQKSLKKLQDRHNIKAGTPVSGPYTDNNASQASGASGGSTNSGSNKAGSGSGSGGGSASPRVWTKRKLSSFAEPAVQPGTGSAQATSWAVYDPKHFSVPLVWDSDDVENRPYGVHKTGERARSFSFSQFGHRGQKSRGGKRGKKSLNVSSSTPAESESGDSGNFLSPGTFEISWTDVAGIFQKVRLPSKSTPAKQKATEVPRSKTIISPFVRKVEGSPVASDDESEEDEDLSDETMLNAHQVVLDGMKDKISAFLETRKKNQDRRKSNKKEKS